MDPTTPTPIGPATTGTARRRSAGPITTRIHRGITIALITFSILIGLTRCIIFTPRLTSGVFTRSTTCIT